MPLPFQVSDPGSPGAGNGPETPHLFAGLLIEGREQSARAFFAAGGSGNHEIAHGQAARNSRCNSDASRRPRCPKASVAIERIERNQMCVVGIHEDLAIGIGCAAIGAARAAARDASRARTLKMPDADGRFPHREHSIRCRQ